MKAKGGARIGAGRPPGKFGMKPTLAIRLSADVKEYLTARFANGRGDHLDSLVRQSLGFKRWLSREK